MGAKISKEPLEAPKPYPPTLQAFNPDDPFELSLVSQSRFYCLVQQSAVWNEYYSIYDMRSPGDYRSNHLVGANEAWKEGDDLEWAWDMLVIVYGKSATDPNVAKFVEALKQAEYPPKSVYILDAPYRKFLKRYKMLSYKSDCADSLPGPVELVPPTKTHVGTYGIHRVHFLRAKSIISRLYVGTIINISARRLFVKTPGINLENTTFDDDPTPEDFVVSVYMKYAGTPPGKKGRNNILIIDESGCDNATILAGWHLIKHRNLTLDQAVESITQRNGFLDTWYTDVLASWVEGV